MADIINKILINYNKENISIEASDNFEVLKKKLLKD